MSIVTKYLEKLGLKQSLPQRVGKVQTRSYLVRLNNAAFFQGHQIVVADDLPAAVRDEFASLTGVPPPYKDAPQVVFTDLPDAIAALIRLAKKQHPSTMVFEAISGLPQPALSAYEEPREIIEAQLAAKDFANLRTFALKHDYYIEVPR